MELNERQMKALAALMVLMILCFGLACASSDPERVKQEQQKKQSSIITVGTGGTKEEAIQDALRSAVERAVGVYIYSSTEVENFQVVKDKIISASRGYVNNYEIVKEDLKEGVFFITLNVQVNVSSIQAAVRKDIKSVTIGEALKDYSLVKQRMEKIRKAEEIVNAVVLRPVDEAYSVDFIGYEIKSVRKDRVSLELAVKLSLNPFYWNEYYNVLNFLSEDCSNADAVLTATRYRESHRGDTYVPWPDYDNGAVCLHVDTAILLRAFKHVSIVGRFGKYKVLDFLDGDKNDVMLHYNLLGVSYNDGECFHYFYFSANRKYYRSGFGSMCASNSRYPQGPEYTLEQERFGYAGKILIDPRKGVIIKKTFTVTDLDFIKNIKDLKFHIISSGYKEVYFNESGREMRWK